MSGSDGIFALLDAAKKYRAGGPGPKLTLLALVERMGQQDEEWVCWPSMATLAHETEQSAGTVRRHVAAFEESGLIERRARGAKGGGRGSNLFVLDKGLLQSAHGDRFAAEANRAPDEPNRASEGVQTAHPRGSAPYMEVPEEQPRTSGASRKTAPLPEPFILTAAMHEWATENVPNIDVRMETAQFCDYWRSRDDKSARRKDWVAAWRVWMRKATPRRNTNGHSRATGLDAVEEYARQEGLIS